MFNWYNLLEDAHCLKLTIISKVFWHKEFNKKQEKYLTLLQNTETEKVSHALFFPIGYLQ